MAHYRKPGKVNVVSVILFVGLVAAVYGGIFFGPAYWRKYQISEVLDEVANKCRGNRVPDAERVDQICQEAKRKILALGVEDQGAHVRVELLPKELTVTATYKEVVRHPFIKRTTILQFSPSITRPRRGGF